jgi:hypothetical protein
MRLRVVPFFVLVLSAAATSRSAPALVRPDDPVVKLPPMLVEENAARLPWRYAQLPGVELLTVCDDDVSTEFAETHFKLNQLLAVILPERFQAHSSVPDSIILFDEDLRKARSREVIADMLQQQHANAEAAGVALPGRSGQFMPNVRVSDVDATAVFTAIKPTERRITFSFTPDRIAFVLERRAPVLPGWFVDGMRAFYEQVKLGDDAIAVQRAEWSGDTIDPASGVTRELPRQLLPLEQVLTRIRPKPDEHALEDELWRAESALFVRWAVARNPNGAREALWRFLDRLDREPLSEALFRECFGFGFAEADQQLAAYLPVALREELTLMPPRLERPPRLEFRPATEAEIARIRGDWERMEIGYVRKRFPELLPKYIDQARGTLARAYRRGVHEPELLAILGLLEIDAGRPEAARGWLEQAVQSHVARPRAYVELAKLRYNDRLTAAANRPFDDAAIRSIIGPIRGGAQLQPPLVEAAALMADVWTHRATPPTAAELAELNALATNFPQVAPLVFRVIYLDGINHDVPAAQRLADAGWMHAVDRETREKFGRVRHDLAALAAAQSGARKN